MKKNNVMRVFSLLLALTLISVCAISGTFAKYVTKAEGEDQARVAKWGIVLTMKDDGFFKSQYETDDTKGYTGLSVLADNEDNLVAPGTKGGTFEATVKGTPEVATRYILEIPAEWADVVLPADTYTDYTYLCDKDNDGVLGYEDTFTLEKDYAPVKWDITVSKGNTTLSLTQVASRYPALAAAMGGNEYGFSATNAVAIVTTYKTQLEDLLESMVTGAQNASFDVTADGNIRLSLDFEPGKDMDYKFNLKWGWQFTDAEGETEVSLNDKADTYLGNVMAGVVDNVPDGVSTEINFSWTATAVQID